MLTQHRRRVGRVAEGGGLLNRYRAKALSGVRIPHSPPSSPSFPIAPFFQHKTGEIRLVFTVLARKIVREKLVLSRDSRVFLG